MKTLFTLTLFLVFLYPLSLIGKTYKKHDTCIYSKDVYVKDKLYNTPKGELTPKLQIVRRRAQEKCMGLTITNRYPDNGVSLCLFYSQIASKGRHKGKRIICVNHACPGTKYEMDESCENYAIKEEPQKRGNNKKARTKVTPKKFIVKTNKTYKILEKCHYGSAGLVDSPLKSLSPQVLKEKGTLVRRMAQEVCLSLRQLEEIPDSGIHSCSFYSQIAQKGRRKGKRVICLNFSCTPSGYTMDDTCLNFKIK